jgi:hypothetical protein
LPTKKKPISILIVRSRLRKSIMKNFAGPIILNISLILFATNCTHSAKLSSNLVTATSIAESDDQKIVHFNDGLAYPMQKRFWKIDPSLEGVFYTWRECVKKFVWCQKWEQKKSFVPFANKEMMKTFYDMDMGFMKRPEL